MKLTLSKFFSFKSSSNFLYHNRLVTARKGVELVCADYKGPNAKVIKPGQNEDDTSAEDEIESDQINIKTEKVK